MQRVEEASLVAEMQMNLKLKSVLSLGARGGFAVSLIQIHGAAPGRRPPDSLPPQHSALIVSLTSTNTIPISEGT